MNSLWADSHIRFHFAGTEQPGRSPLWIHGQFETTEVTDGSTLEQVFADPLKYMDFDPDPFQKAQSTTGILDMEPTYSKERIDFEMRLIHNGCAEYNGDEGGAE